MNIEKTEQEALKLQEHLNTKYPDLVAHIDTVEGTDDIVISFFWNRISTVKWNDAKTFKCKSSDFHKVVNSEILPFFEE
ncbi:hypothetical protein DMZ43_05615 [Meridianimaribacter sp. CL38]|uniref:hypothetical protein n=1 Tax=Meridianimaribacter sp. CL38 TaxID=2213021 RepID=UPI001040DF1F|nr:hypothetical protein [Meridianimaribacter sp. CL38]TBV26544.1 hypothetical protein DMZ43_05615 [Meridianimaribacter sp. CL38]